MGDIAGGVRGAGGRYLVIPSGDTELIQFRVRASGGGSPDRSIGLGVTTSKDAASKREPINSTPDVATLIAEAVGATDIVDVIARKAGVTGQANAEITMPRARFERVPEQTQVTVSCPSPRCEHRAQVSANALRRRARSGSAEIYL